MFTDIMFSSDCTNIMTNGKEKLAMKKVSSDDMGFCSGGEDSSFLDNEPDDVRSPTDASEDSIDVKISPISIRNKRKSSEPRRASNPTSSGPLKKRVCRELQTGAPFRPWSPPGYFRPPSPVKREEEVPRVPVHPGVGTLSTVETERMILKASEHFPGLKNSSGVQQSKREQRNYKNMTRERRIEANARERTRVHTISAAFDTLRKAIPSYSHNQKLSKLSVLRIACSYIMTLSSIVSDDEEGASRNVEMVSKTIQREGKLRKKKDDED